MGLTYLKGFPSVGGTYLTGVLQGSLQNFFEWGFLTAGGYFNVEKSQTSSWGADQSRLRPSTDPRFSNGQSWEGFRQDWVWQSGINLQLDTEQPIQVSGVWVNNTFHLPTQSGFEHTIDYPNGRIIFDNPIPTSSVVQASYSYRWASIQNAENPFLRKLMLESFRNDSNSFLSSASGNYSVLPEERVQLPTVFIEVVDYDKKTGLALGGGQIITRTVLFHIFAEQSWDRDNLLDAINYQNRTTFRLLDFNKMANDGYTPLNSDGSISEDAMTYPDLIRASGDGGYAWKNAFVVDTRIQPTDNLSNKLVRGQVKMSIEVEMGQL